MPYKYEEIKRKYYELNKEAINAYNRKYYQDNKIQIKQKRKENKENSLQDTGIDIIQINSDTEFSLVQCKNGYKNGLTYSELCGFFAWMASLDNLQGYVYYRIAS